MPITPMSHTAACGPRSTKAGGARHRAHRERVGHGIRSRPSLRIRRLPSPPRTTKKISLACRSPTNRAKEKKSIYFFHHLIIIM